MPRTLLLDTQENIFIDISSPLRGYIQPLYTLKTGIKHLAQMIRKTELWIDLHAKADCNIRDISEDDKKRFNIDLIDRNLLSCYAHWFSTSLTNYVRLIGLIKILTEKNKSNADLANDSKLKKDVKDFCRKYTTEVIPEVLAFRNKVSAHFSATDPFTNDNLADFEQLAYLPVNIHANYIAVHGMSLVVDGEQSNAKIWFPTKEFDRLCPRFWPNDQLPQLGEHPDVFSDSIPVYMRRPEPTIIFPDGQTAFDLT